MDKFSIPIRAAVRGELRKPEPLPFGLRGVTPNHAMQMATAAYGFDPSSQRLPLLRYLKMQEDLCGHAGKGGLEEFGGRTLEPWSDSHFGQWIAAADGALLIAMRAGDQEMLEAVVRWETGEMAAENLCAAPANAHPAIRDHVVMTGARCHIGPGQNEGGGGDADQRAIRDRRRLWLLGRRVRIPPNIETSMDYTGLWCLLQIDQAFRDGKEWAAKWPVIRSQIANAGPDLLPTTYNAVEIERSKSGHVMRFLSVSYMMRPSLWALADYVTGEERYGCDPSWPRDFKPKVNAIPAPECPGGPGTIYRLPVVGRGVRAPAPSPPPAAGAGAGTPAAGTAPSGPGAPGPPSPPRR